MSQPRPFETLGIVGSGTIATGLARLASDHGDVVLWARSDASAKRATTIIEDAADVVTLAEAEDLPGHGAAVSVRFEQ